MRAFIATLFFLVAFAAWADLTYLPSDGGDNAGPPATGVDTTLTLYENSDHDGDTYQVVIPAEVDMLVSHTNTVGPGGFPTDRIETTYVDDIASAAKATNPEAYIKWEQSEPNADTGNGHKLSDNTNIYNTRISVGPMFSGRLQAKALSVRLGLPTAAAADYCRATVRYTPALNGTAYYDLDPTTLGVDTGWTQCTGVLEWGPSSDNSGQTGAGVDTPDGAGDSYMLLLDSCTCPSEECVFVVAVQDRDEGGGETCLDVDDVHFGLVVGEVFP